MMATRGYRKTSVGGSWARTLHGGLAERDPASLRPGRLLAQRVFRLLDEIAAARLAAHLGRAFSGDGPMPLVELFNPPDPALTMSGPPRRGRLGFAPTSAQ